MNTPEGRARPPGGPCGTGIGSPVRVALNHTTPTWVKAGQLFFVTICCHERGTNQLCIPTIGEKLTQSAQFYHNRGHWFLRLFVLMPDHVHALIVPALDKTLAGALSDWKRYASTHHQVKWQKNFIDHRVRSDENWEEKAAYIRMNPIRAGLIREGEEWPYVLENFA